MHSARADPRRLIRYLRWGVYGGLAAPLISMVLVVDSWPAPTVAAAVAVTVGIAALQVLARWSLDRIDPVGRPVDRRLVLAAAVVVALATAVQPVILGVAGGWPFSVGVLLLLAICLLAMRLRWWHALLLALGVDIGAAAVLLAVRGPTEATGRMVGFWVVVMPVIVAVWWTTGWMLRVMRELQEARDRAATAAVSEERARISRDLHDLFGQTLATIAVKSELAAELSRRGRHDRAIDEMREVHRIADESGGRVRAVVRGERQIALADELAGARALLGSAQIVCRVEAEPVDHPHADVLVWVLREAVTNVLRHTDADTVELQVGPTPEGGVVLRIADDDPPGRGITEGAGLTGMRERVEATGGTVQVGTRDGWFRIEAVLPPGRNGP